MGENAAIPTGTRVAMKSAMRFRALFAFAALSFACGGTPTGQSGTDTVSGAQVGGGGGGGSGGSSGGSSSGGSSSGSSGGSSSGGGSSGSGGSSGGSGGSGGSGSASPGALEVIPAMYGGDGKDTIPIADGDAIPLTFPLQGGHVLMIGARIRNLHTTTIKIHGRLVSPIDGTIAGEDTRTVVVSPVEGDETLMQTNIETNSQVANVTVCPNYAPRAIDGQPWIVEITVTELYADAPRTAVGTRTVTPTCGANLPSQKQCQCECDADYVIGKCPISKGGG